MKKQIYSVVRPGGFIVVRPTGLIVRQAGLAALLTCIAELRCWAGLLSWAALLSCMGERRCWAAWVSCDDELQCIAELRCWAAPLSFMWISEFFASGYRLKSFQSCCWKIRRISEFWMSYYSWAVIVENFRYMKYEQPSITWIENHAVTINQFCITAWPKN